MTRRHRRRSSSRASPAPTPPRGQEIRPPAAAGPDLGAVALWIAIAALLLARAALPFVPAMWGWSLNLMRYVHPVVAWGPWTLAALALLPPVGRRIEPWLARAGDAMATAPGRSLAAWALAAAGLVWLTPDQVRYVGDFLLRQGTVEIGEKPALFFPQALPLDVFMHYTLPHYFAATALVDANGAARVLGMLEAATLAMLAVSFARALGLRGAVAFAGAAVVLCGGYLGMFTGYSKAFAELCLIVAAAGAFGLRVVRDGRGFLPLAIVVAIGVTLHRSALGLVPAAALAFVLGIRAQGRGAWRRPDVVAAIVIATTAIAIMTPRIVAVVTQWDAAHFAPGTAREQGGILAAALAGARPTDMVNLLMMLSPLSVLIPLLLPLARLRDAGGNGAGTVHGRELALLVTLALPFVSVMPFLHPARGMYQDWDDFAATGVAVSLIASWVVARVLQGSPRHAWLAAAVAGAVMAPSLQWLAHHRDLERGLQRVEAFMAQPPARSGAERATTWDFLGIRYFALERWDDAARAFGHAVETGPSPRVIQQYAMAQTMRGKYREAQAIYHRLLSLDPKNALGWLGLGTTSANAHDFPEARRAAHELLRLQPGNADALHLLQSIETYEAKHPTP